MRPRFYELIDELVDELIFEIEERQAVEELAQYDLRREQDERYEGYEEADE